MTITIKRQAKNALAADERARAKGKKSTADSFTNFAAGLGYGTENLLSGGTYGFNPITRNRTLLEWIHRGSWLGGVAIDLKADDMTRMGVEIRGDMDPAAIEELQEAATAYKLWTSINRTVKWARLYGGALALILIDGQKPATPLRLETVGKGQFKGLLVLDRWMVEPSLQELVEEVGPALGLPKYYTITAMAPALRGVRIHHTRFLRLIGIELPFWQSMMENLWGISVLERLYDRMVAFDSATMGAAQLCFKAYLRVMKIKGYREIISAGGPALEGLIKAFDFMRLMQTNEGISLVDQDDELEAMTAPTMTGVGEAVLMLAQQLSGALQIPLVRLFGQSPAGLNSTGESDVRTYYDGIAMEQNRDLKEPITTMYRCLAQSEAIPWPEGTTIEFRPLWQMTPEQKSAVATEIIEAVTKAKEAFLISDQVAMQELKQSSLGTGIFTNITKEDIEKADSEIQPPLPELPAMGEEESEAEPTGKRRTSRDADGTALERRKWHGLDVSIESRKGSQRGGVILAHDYGYLNRVPGVDGDSLDVFMGPDPEASSVYVVHTRKPPDFSEYDEDKCFLDFGSETKARSAFFANFDQPEHFGSMDVFPIEVFLKRIHEQTSP